jgi:hypothetical protein
LISFEDDSRRNTVMDLLRAQRAWPENSPCKHLSQTMVAGR